MRGKGSPHRSQIGGVICTIDRQHFRHTQLDNGSSSIVAQTAQDGARSAAMTESATLEIVGVTLLIAIDGN